MIHLQIAASISIPPESSIRGSDLLPRAAQETLRQGRAPGEASLSIRITDDAQIQALNQQYLGLDTPTDVLSFPAGETDPDNGEIYLGDIAISYARAQAQAQSSGHTVTDELQLLVVHGVLHLLGYDHATEAEKAVMWALQAKILAKLGCTLTAPGV